MRIPFERSWKNAVCARSSRRTAASFFAVLSFFFILPVLTSRPNVVAAQDGALLEKKETERAVYFAYRSFWPEHETMKRFAAAGVHTYCVFPSNTVNSLGEPYSKYPAIWRYPNVYDWDSFYRQFDEILAFDADAEFLCMIDLNSPQWLARTLGMDGDGNFDSFIDLSNCVANRRWRDETARWLDDFLAKSEARYGDRIRAYILACGQTDEWMDYSGERSSRAKDAKYAVWTKANALPVLPFPSFSDFDSATFENFVRDPQKEADVLQAVRFEQELIADSILDFAKLTKDATERRKEVGVFFGYILELGGWRGVGCDHLEYERVASSPDVDFFISPGTYSEREIGGGSGSMYPNETLLLAGKRGLRETDHRTTTYNCALNEFVEIAPIARWKSENEDVAGLRRELCLALTERSSIWFFDMWGGAYRSDRAFENVATMKRVWDEYSGRQGESSAEILLVVDPQSAARLNARDGRYGQLFHSTRNWLNHTGAPFAVCSFDDLKTRKLDRIKLAILPGTFYLTPERRDLLRERLLKDGRSVVWVGPSGLDDGKTLDVERVRETTGFEYDSNDAGGVGIAERRGFFGQGDGIWTSIYASNWSAINSETLKKWAKNAGATICVDDGSPVYSTERLLAVHSKNGGVKKIELPRNAGKVVEAFSNKTVATNAKSFEYHFSEPETALFVLFDKEEDGDKDASNAVR